MFLHIPVYCVISNMCEYRKLQLLEASLAYYWLNNQSFSSLQNHTVSLKNQVKKNNSYLTTYDFISHGFHIYKEELEKFCLHSIQEPFVWRGLHPDKTQPPAIYMRDLWCHQCYYIRNSVIQVCHRSPQKEV